MRRYKLAAALVAPVLISAGLIVGSAGAASAVPTCTTGYTCFFPLINYGGNQGRFSTTQAWWGAYVNQAGYCSSSGYTWNDCAESVENSQSKTNYFYWDINCGGASWGLSPGYVAGNLGGWNDQISANHYATVGSC